MRVAQLNFDIDRYLNRAVPPSKLHLLPTPISRFLGYRHGPPQQIGNVPVWFWAFIGAFSGLLIVEAVFQTARLKGEGVPIVIASLVRFIAPSAMRYLADARRRAPRPSSNIIPSTRPSPSRGTPCSARSSLP